MVFVMFVFLLLVYKITDMGAELVSLEPRRTTDCTLNVSLIRLTEGGCKGQEKKLANNSCL